MESEHASVSDAKNPVVQPTKIDTSIANRIEDARTRRGEHYARRLALFIEDTPQRQHGGTLFLGDSITEGFPLDRIFPEKNVINRGIGGDRIEGVTERLDVSVADLKASKVYLMIGINDIVGAPSTPLEEFAASYNTLLDELVKCAPKAEVYVQSLLPLRDQFEPHNQRVAEFNPMLQTLAHDHGVHWIDLHSRFKNKKGLLRKEYSSDGIHLTLDGYIAWLETIMTEAAFFECMKSVAPLWIERHSRRCAVNAIDPPHEGTYPGSRGPDQLIIYTPQYGYSRTGTNQWGTEAVVRNGVVEQVGGNDSPIPDDGFIVSGHGKASEWISLNLRKGLAVSYDQDYVKIQTGTLEEMTPNERLISLKLQLMETLANARKDAAVQGARFVLEKIREFDRKGTTPSLAQVREFSQRLNNSSLK